MSENRLVKTVKASFNKIMGKLTEMSQQKNRCYGKNDAEHVSCNYSSSCYLPIITSHCWCETSE